MYTKQKQIPIYTGSCVYTMRLADGIEEQSNRMSDNILLTFNHQTYQRASSFSYFLLYFLLVFILSLYFVFVSL